MENKVTLISTVFNEEATVTKFLESITSQSQLPDEIVIVDAGSTDKTFSILNNFKFTISKSKVKIIQKKGNRSIGRNEAIRRAANSLIVCSDAGCTLDNDWIKNIVEPFKNQNVDVVAGYYKPTYNTIFERALSVYTSVMPDRVDPNNFLPSSRSVAFTKVAWKKVGGYPEYLSYCEDLVFAKNLKNDGLTFVFAKSAIVYWPQRQNLFQAAKQFYNYAKGDGLAHYFRPQTPLLFIRYTLGILFLIVTLLSGSVVLLKILIALFLLYLFWAVWKNYKYINHWQALFILPMLQITADIAVLIGTTVGIISSWGIQKKL